MMYYFLVLLISFVSSLILTRALYPRLKNAGMFGNDVNKPDRPAVAEMGGVAIVAGFTAGLLLAIFFNTFALINANLIFLLVAIITIHSIAFIGLVDDLIDIPQAIKALLPLFAAIPLVVVKAAGSTALAIPFVGVIDFGLFYLFLLVPLAVAVCSNLTNMLAGFNGMEAGMGFVMFAVLAFFGFTSNRPELLLISLAMMGSLLGFLVFNRYPSKIFPGDVGTLSIGAALACAVILGNFESLGVLLVLPYVIDFMIKAINRFPSRGWAGIYKDGKLYSPEIPISFAQHVMKHFKGISEQNLVFFFVSLEAVFALVAVLIFVLKI
ncbi:hypothetical protein HY990_01385 [Candidatus Micrarchaeota archaeon]|nr:hypothetical protein [Candidatus Micrarchaeota archaeon]